ncbi:hypothetical protein Gpo141_00008562 [Globisporangium polare]
MARIFSSVLLLVAALAVASTSATLSDSEKFAAEIKELKTEISKLEFVQAIEKSLTEASAVSSFAASSSTGSGSKASSVTASSSDDDLDIEALPTSAPKSPTAAPSATSLSSSSGSKATAAVVKTPAPTTKTSGASTLAPAAAALATAVVYAML